MPTQRKVAEAFIRGEAAKGSHFDSVQRGAVTLLCGYTNAVYACRFPNGDILVFEKWKKYSVTTNTKHFSALRGALIGVKHMVNTVDQPKSSGFDAEKYGIVASILES